MDVTVRPFRDDDAAALGAILGENGQLAHPDIDGPEAMRRVRTGQMLRDFQTGLETREMTFEGYLAAIQKDADTFHAEVEEQAEQSVREELALEALARHLGLEATDEDVDAELAQLADAGGGTVEEMRRKWEELGLLSVAEQQALHGKAVRWLLENVTVTEVAPAEAEAEADESSDDPTDETSAEASGESLDETSDDLPDDEPTED